MDSKWSSSRILHVMLFLSVFCSTRIDCQPNIIFDVVKFGAVSGGKADNNKAFLDTWTKACQASGGVMLVPQGTYLLSGARFDGRLCNGPTTLTIDGVVIASNNATLDVDFWIAFESVNGLTINGKGTFDGNGAVSWSRPPCLNLTCTLPPKSLALDKVSNVRIQDITSTNSKFFHMSINECKDVTIEHVNIKAPKDSPNTDGVHIESSSGIRIANSVIQTGDDCVSIGEGSSNVNITGVFCGPGHGISIGSLGKYTGEKDVSSITVANCTLNGTTNGLRIKTFAYNNTLTAFDLTFQRIVMINVRNPIIIDQNYCPQKNMCQEGESSVQIKGVKFIGVEGSSVEKVAVKIDCSKIKPCQDIQLSGLKLYFQGRPTTADCSNADCKFLEPNQVPSKCSPSSISMIPNIDQYDRDEL